MAPQLGGAQYRAIFSIFNWIQKRPKPASKRQEKLQRKLEPGWRRGRKLPATTALQKAIAWQKAIENDGISRADIARREGITRARVTQVMALLELSAEAQAEILAGEGRAAWSIRRALDEVRRPSG